MMDKNRIAFEKAWVPWYLRNVPISAEIYQKSQFSKSFRLISRNFLPEIRFCDEKSSQTRYQTSKLIDFWEFLLVKSKYCFTFAYCFDFDTRRRLQGLGQHVISDVTMLLGQSKKFRYQFGVFCSRKMYSLALLLRNLTK